MSGGEDPPPLSHIEEFYADFNTVCSLTTSGERGRLVPCLETYRLPEDLDTERLREVFRLMKRVSQRIHVVDPEMLAPKHRSWDPVKQLFRAQFFEIKGLRNTGNGAAVTVATHVLEPEKVLRFIQEYEDPPQGWEFPSMAELLNRVGSGVTRSQEIHIWQVKGGRWVKLDSHFTFLDIKRRP
jgi:hypothetical protein